MTQRVEFPDGMTINDYWGGSLSVWCDEFNVSFGSVIIPAEKVGNYAWPAPDMECVGGGSTMDTSSNEESSDSSRTSVTLGLLTVLQLAVGGALVY